MTDWRRIPDAPGQCFEPRYVYVCLFDQVAKVGVTRSPRKRFPPLRREHGEIRNFHVALVGFFESSRREAAVKFAFGWPMKYRGRRSERFPVEHYSAAIEMIGQNTPEFRKEWLRCAADHDRSDAQYGRGEAA